MNLDRFIRFPADRIRNIARQESTQAHPGTRGHIRLNHTHDTSTASDSDLYPLPYIYIYQRFDAAQSAGSFWKTFLCSQATILEQFDSKRTAANSSRPDTTLPSWIHSLHLVYDIHPHHAVDQHSLGSPSASPRPRAGRSPGNHHHDPHLDHDQDNHA